MKNYYAIHHTTRFTYSEPITENVMEVRKKPRQDGGQVSYEFALSTFPKSKVFMAQDAWGNVVHHFNVNQPHTRLEIIAEAHVGVDLEELPGAEVTAAVNWSQFEGVGDHVDFWDFTHPSFFAEDSPAVQAFLRQSQLPGEMLPFATAESIMGIIFNRFAYRQDTTRVDSRIEELLEKEAGVCQDFTHLMISSLRYLGIPARYVSGYLMHREGGDDRSAEDASHAWVEGYFPTLGWIGFDPTNNLMARERHIRVAIGRDYADLPPTRGVFKGQAESTLAVAVDVRRTAAPQLSEEPNLAHSEWVQQANWELQMQQQQ